MKKGFKKITAMLLAGLVACAALTACGDEDQVKVSADDPMSPGEIHNALKKSSDYTVTVNGGDTYSWTLKKDNSIVWYKDASSASDGTYFDAATNTQYTQTSLGGAYSSGTLAGYDTPDLFAYDEVAKRTVAIDALLNDNHFISTNEGIYTANETGLAAIDCNSAKISISGMVYTIEIDDFWIITIDFSDVALTLPTVTE